MMIGASFVSTPRPVCYTLGVLDPSKPRIFLAIVNKIKIILFRKRFPLLGYSVVVWAPGLGM